MSALDLQQVFTDATTKHFSEPLPGGVVVKACDSPTWNAAYERIRPAAFPRGEGVDMRRVYTEAENERLAQLNALVGSGALEHKLAFFDGEEAVGTYWGMQEGWGRYYMIATMILPSHQGRGIYSAFLERLVAVVRESGFREIYSRHHPDNNAILVPKLKAGFLIASFEITPNFGLLVHMRLPLMEKLREVYAFRIEATQNAAAMEAAGIVTRR